MERVRGQGADPFEGKSPHPKFVRREVRDYLRAIAGSLGLCSWYITVSAGLPNGDAIAETFIRDSGEEAIVALSPTFFDWPERQRRKTLIHELLHATLKPYAVAAYGPVEGTLSAQARDVWVSALDEQEERVIDRLAYGLVDFFPRSPERA